MTIREKERIFKIDEMIERIYGHENDNVETIAVSDRTEITLFGVFFREKIVSRIEVFRTEEFIHVHLFMGNLEIASYLEKGDIIMITEFRADANGKDYVDRITVREARDYDLIETK